MSINLIVGAIRADGFLAIGDALESGRWPSTVSITLRKDQDCISSISGITNALKKGMCPDGFSLNLRGNSLSDLDCKYLADALVSGNCPENLKIDLRNNNIKDEGALIIAEALSSGNFPNGLDLLLGHNGIGGKGAKHLIQALNVNRKSKIHLYIGVNDATNEDLNEISESLKSNNFSDNTRISLDFHKIDINGIKCISELLGSGEAPKCLHIGFGASRENKIGANEISFIAKALELNKCPESISISFSSLELCDDFIHPIVMLLENDSFPLGLSLDLSHNKISDSGAKMIVDALMHSKRSHGLQINLNHNDITVAGVLAVCEMLHTYERHKKLKIKFDISSYDFRKTDRRETLRLIKKFESDTLPKGVSVNLSYIYYGDDNIKLLANALGANSFFTKTLNILRLFTKNYATIAIAKAINKGIYNNGLNINFDLGGAGLESAKTIANLLKSGRCPKGFDLTFNGYNGAIGDIGTRLIAQAIESGCCPDNLNINLFNNGIGKKGATAIAYALTSDMCPNNISVDLSSNSGGNEALKVFSREIQFINKQLDEKPNIDRDVLGIRADITFDSLEQDSIIGLADALKSKKIRMLNLNLMWNPIKYGSLEHLAHVLQSGECSNGLEVYLKICEIDNRGAKLIADALCSGKCPSPLLIDLGINSISNEGLRYITEALKSENCPSFLDLRLYSNMIDDDGAVIIVDLIKSGKYPDKLKLDLSHNSFSNNGNEIVTKALNTLKKAVSANIGLDESVRFEEEKQEFSENHNVNEHITNLEIDLSNIVITDNNILTIRKYLLSAKVKENLQINLEKSKFTDEQITIITDTILENKNISSFKIDLSHTILNDNIIKYFSEGLISGRFPENFSLILSHTSISNFGYIKLFRPLYFGKCPPGFQLDLYGNKISDDGLYLLAKALNDESCPNKFKLRMLANHNLNEVRALTRPFHLGKYPEGFELDLSFQGLSFSAISIIVNALKWGNCSRNFSLCLHGTNFGKAGLKCIVDLIKSERCPKSMTLKLSYEDIGSQGLNYIIDTLGSKLLSDEIIIEVSGYKLTNMDAVNLSEILGSS